MTSALVVPLATKFRPARAAQPIRVGVLTDLSGQYQDSAGVTSVVCATQAVEEFVAANPGIPVEIISADHQQKPDVASAVARQWFERDGVDMIVNCNNSAVALAVSTLAKDLNKVHVNTAAVSAELTGPACSPNLVHWTYDTWELAHSTGSAIVRNGGKKWFFVTANYTFGKTLQRDTTAVVEAAGGKVVGSATYPFPGTVDFSSYLLQAQSSGADVVAFANASGDFINCMKQAAEFGLSAGGIKLAGLVVFTTDIHALGLDATKGLNMTSTFYWDLNDRTRSFLQRVKSKTPHNWPNELHAGDYAGTLHYLKAVKALGAAQAKASGRDVVAMMKQLPTDDDCFGIGSVRADGRTLHNAYLLEVKSAQESKGPWDLCKLVSTTPGDQAFRPLAEGACPMIHI
ncbi:MAG TPA: ABC transporter substrate-binding protein [Stellaceae bacterium]|nr:ABC transporter substrate-binding protein [Stellaceae bacterium]